MNLPLPVPGPAPASGSVVSSPAQLPPVEPHLAAMAVEDLTPRLRKKLDAAIERCAGLPVTVDGQTVSVSWGEDAVVTLTPGSPGSVTDPGEARCSCLLAPRCLHRAAVLNACPVAGVGADPDLTAGREASRHEGASRGRSSGGENPENPENTKSRHVPNTDFTGGGTAVVSGTGPAGRLVTASGVSTDAGSAAGDAVAASDVGSAGHTAVAAEALRDFDPPAPTTGQVAAAAGVWNAAVAVLVAGVPGAGAVLQAELLRAAHTARLAGLPRAEAAALGVVRGLRAARARHDDHRLADLVSALRELLLTSGRLAAADPDPTLVGTARRAYRPGGALRVYGVCREPVISATGYAGVVTHLLAEDGRWFSVADVKPGGSARARGAATAAVALGTAGMNHAQLARRGLLISGATVSPGGRLGAGRGVRATPVPGMSWSEGPLAALFARPLDEVADALLSGGAWSDPQTAEETERPVGCDLVIVGAEGDRLLARRLPAGGSGAGGACGEPVKAARKEPGEAPSGGEVSRKEPGGASAGWAQAWEERPGGASAGRAEGTAEGPLVRLVPASSHPDLAHVANLRQLASLPGLRVRVLGRLDPGRAATLRPLAVGPVPGDGPTLRLPAEWLGHADFGYDHLQGSHLPPRDVCPPWAEETTAAVDPVTGSPLWRVRRLVELAVSGGRRAVAESARGGDSLTQRASLRRAGFETAAELVGVLTVEADRRSRDVFGRLVDADGDRYAWSWLATALHLTVTERALVQASWHDHRSR
ncbi:hypothetical protein [Streptosporangium sp. NPDC004631]